MIKPPEFNEIIAEPLSEADKDQFLSEQCFMRSLEWAAEHQDLFNEATNA